MRFSILTTLLLVGVLAASGCGPIQAGAPTPHPTTSIPVRTALPTFAVPAIGQASPTPSGGTVNQGSTSAPPIATPPEAPSDDEEDSAVQTVLDYFDAINQRDYSYAYGLWGRGGAASGQTSEEFARGYSDTVCVSLLLGLPKSQRTSEAQQVTVPVTLMSIANQPDNMQKLQRYQGSYALRPADASDKSEWKIATASIKETAVGPLPTGDVVDPAALLQSYFGAINRREFARAYSYWDNLGQASRQSFTQFERGFAATKQVAIEIGTPQQNAGAGNVYADVSVKIVANQDDGSTKSYTGSYTAHRANIPPFDQLGWRIVGAKVTQATDGTGR